MSIVLPQSWQPLRYHTQQAKLWRSSSRLVAVAAGRGSGKTEISRRKVVMQLALRKPWPDPMYFYALPTFNQAKRVAWLSLKSLVPKAWLAKPPNESDLCITTIWGSRLYVVGMDKPQRIEGNQWDGGILDESCDQRPKVYDRTIQPALTHRSGWCWLIGVPKRSGIGSADFKARFMSGIEGSNIVESYTWPSSDILPPEEIARAMDTLDEKDFNEQYNANWETIGGGIFHAFDARLNESVAKHDPNRPLIVGSDFNVDPMAWVICQQHEDGLHVIDELFIRNCNTPEALNKLWHRYGQRHASDWLFYGDATGRARKTSATASDYAHIRNDDRFMPKQVRYPKANPARRDRFSACNAQFCSASGLRKLFVHSRCTNLLTDLENRAYKSNGEPDDYGSIGHISDALGYVVYMRTPLMVTTNNAKTEVSFNV